MVSINNRFFSMRYALTVLTIVGFWAPGGLKGTKKRLHNCLTCLSFVYMEGIYLATELIYLIIIWGDIAAIFGTIFIFLTNLTLSLKSVNIVMNRSRIKDVIDAADARIMAENSDDGKAILQKLDIESRNLIMSFVILTAVTVVGWTVNVEKGRLPLQAWYPMDITQSPWFEIAFFHQVTALILTAFMNVGQDSLVTTMIVQCRCQLQLLGLRLKMLCEGLDVKQLTQETRNKIKKRLRECVIQHQETLEMVEFVQTTFSVPTLVQLTVSVAIICVTAFQIVFQIKDLVPLTFMTTYLVDMMLQVFIYCYHGNQLCEESMEILVAAYDFPWYCCYEESRHYLLMLMARASRPSQMKPGGITTLSLAVFMSIIKASYSFFTVLQSFERNKQ